MYSGMTRGMKAYVSTMLTESDWSIAVPVLHFKRLPRRNAECKPTNAPQAGLFVLTPAVGPDAMLKASGDAE